MYDAVNISVLISFSVKYQVKKSNSTSDSIDQIDNFHSSFYVSSRRVYFYRIICSRLT